MASFRSILDSIEPRYHEKAKSFAAANPLKVIELWRSPAVYDSGPELMFLYDLDGYSYYLRAIDPPWPVMTRAQAIEKGLIKYWTGRPCKNGHVARRYVKGGACQHCVSSYQKDRSKLGLTKLTFNVPDTHKRLVETNVEKILATQPGQTGLVVHTAPEHVDAIISYAGMLNAHHNA